MLSLTMIQTCRITYGAKEAFEHYSYCLHFNDRNALLPPDKTRRGRSMPLEQKTVAAQFSILYLRAATNFTVTVQKYIGRFQDLRNKVKRWTTTAGETSSEANQDNHIFFNLANS